MEGYEDWRAISDQVLHTRCSASHESSPFKYGIYTQAISSGIVESRNFFSKFCYCLWWGMQNLRYLYAYTHVCMYIYLYLYHHFISFRTLMLVFHFMQYTWPGASDEYLPFRGSIFYSNRRCWPRPFRASDWKYTGEHKALRLQNSHNFELVFLGIIFSLAIATDLSPVHYDPT